MAEVFAQNREPPFHPQTNGKLERYHRALNDDVNRQPYEAVEDLEPAIRDFVEILHFQLFTTPSAHQSPPTDRV